MAYPYLFDHDDSYIVDGGYCRAEDVQLIFKNIKAYSTLDITEIKRRVAEAAVEIDRLLENDYLVPISGDAPALQVLRLINSRLAAAIIHEVYYREGSSNTTIPGEQWRTYAELMLKDIVDGVITFFTAPVRPGGENPQFPPGKGATFNSDDDATANPAKAPLFTRGSRGNLSSLGDLI